MTPREKALEEALRSIEWVLDRGEWCCPSCDAPRPRDAAHEALRGFRHYDDCETAAALALPVDADKTDVGKDGA